MNAHEPRSEPSEVVVETAQAPRRPFVSRKERILRVVRVLSYCAVVCTVLGLLALRSAYGDVKQSALALGHELGNLGDVGSDRPLRLNGQAIYVASSIENVSISDFLDGMEEHCKNESAGDSKGLSHLPDAAKQKFARSIDDRTRFGVLRKETDVQGVVACFVRSPSKPEAPLMERLGEFIETGDMSRVGDLRYAYVEKTDTGLAHIVTAWTDGPFNLYDFMPGSKDAPGSDPANAPRPEGAVRLLSATVDNLPYSLRIYDAASSPAEVLKSYDAAMPSRGWKVVVAGDAHRVFSREGVDVMISANARKGRTVVSFVELPGN